MKKMFLLAFLAIMCVQVQAQIVTSRSSMITTTRTPQIGWSTFGLEYLPSTFKYDDDSESFSGLALVYTRATSLSGTTPLFLEWGIGGQYSFYSKHGVDINFASVKIPINLMYDFQIPNTSINIDPYIGLKCRGNVWGTVKSDYDDEKYDLFDKDEGDCKRFQVGWNIGVKLRFNNSFFAGVSYGTDFNEFDEDTKINELSLSAGIVF